MSQAPSVHMPIASSNLSPSQLPNVPPPPPDMVSFPTHSTTSTSSVSEPDSPNFSPLMSTSCSSLSSYGPKRRRVTIADGPSSPLTAKRRMIMADMLFGGIERTAPSLAVICILLFLLFQVIGAPRSNPMSLDLSTVPFSTTLSSSSPRKSNIDVVNELVRWKDPAYARDRIKVYYYDLPAKFNAQLVRASHANPPKIRDPYCDENFYSAENTLSNFFKSSSVRTMNASEADYFYVPVFSTCYLLTHLPNDVKKTGAFFNEAMQYVINEFPHWNRSDGRDHVLMFAQGFGARLAGDWTKYRHATFLVHNGDYEESHFDTHKDIVVPPDLSHYLKPVGLVSPNQLLQKKNFVLFGGQVLSSSISDHRGSNYSGGVRQYIASDLRTIEGYKVTGVRSNSYIKDMMESVFCLAPHGWHKWSPRPAYAVLLGCIPVVISEKQELFLEDLIDYDEISYWVRPHEMRQLDSKLRSLRSEELTKRELAMRDVWRLFWYGRDGLAEQAILYSLYRKLGSSRPDHPYI